MRRMQSASLTGVLMLLAASSALCGCSETEASADAQARPQPVQITTVVTHPLQRRATYTGTVRPRYESDLGFRVGGKITERLVEIGDRVREGEPLARLDQTDFDLSLASSHAELEAANSALRQAGAEVERVRSLFDKALVAQAALDAALTGFDEARGRVQRAGNAVELAAHQRDYAVLRANYDGVVTGVSTEVGQVVALGTVVMRLSREDALDAVVAIPEHRLADIRTARASIALWGEDGPALPATLRELSPDVDAASRTYEARFAIDAADPVLTFGRTVTLSLEEADGRAVSSIPLSAVLNTGKGPHAFVLTEDGGSVAPVAVELVQLTETSALIGSGLDEGDRIVTLGLHKLDTSLPVRVVEEIPTQAPAL